MERISLIKDDLKYIINFFDIRRFLYLIVVFIFLSYFFAFLQNLSSTIFTYKAIGISSVFNYLSFTVIGTLFHSSLVSSILFFLTILSLSIYTVIFISKFKNSPSLSGSGLGIISGIITFFGLGCVSCGGLILISLLGAIGVTGVATLLPFNGFEIQFLAFIVSLASLIIFVRKSRVEVCKI